MLPDLKSLIGSKVTFFGSDGIGLLMELRREGYATNRCYLVQFTVHQLIVLLVLVSYFFYLVFILVFHMVAFLILLLVFLLMMLFIFFWASSCLFPSH